MPVLEMSLGETLRAVRQRKKMSLRELADECGISHAMIGNYENDKASPRFDKLQRICKALDIEILSLVNGAD